MRRRGHDDPVAVFTTDRSDEQGAPFASDADAPTSDSVSTTTTTAEEPRRPRPVDRQPAAVCTRSACPATGPSRRTTALVDLGVAI